MVKAVRVAMGDQDSRKVMRDDVRLRRIVDVQTFRLCFEGLLIPYFNDLHLVVVRVIFQGLHARILTYSFRASAKCAYHCWGFLVFLHVRVRANGVNHASPTAVFHCSEDYIRVTDRREFQRADLGVGVLREEPTLQRAVSPSHRQVSRFCVQVRHRIPIRHLFRIRRCKYLYFKRHVALGATAFDHNRLSVGVMVFRRRAMVTDQDRLIVIQGDQVSTREDEYLLVQADRQRRESVMRVTHAYP